jgi:hypothetical protein
MTRVGSQRHTKKRVGEEPMGVNRYPGVKLGSNAVGLLTLA